VELKKRLTQLARSVGILVSSGHSSRPIVTATLRKMGLAKPFMPTPAAIIAYRAVVAEKVALIDRLPSMYRQQAHVLIWRHVMRGFDAAGLARELSKQFGITPDRAKRIARSQCRMAHAVMENADRLEAGIREAVWCYETRCRIRGHRASAGRTYSLAQGASLNDKQLWPGSEPECYCSSIEIKPSQDG
jgi:uncharacterized protein with gpF-like domain